ncbi:MAG TPA: 2-amino-4-hydroxy-6-hydroxymethyldihydropteridine diphosphokinase [Bacteroidota bacterium]|nr:2-amino-4-hydroxy-6-hydroxymethyldihydropteridine diphosphokinase [Bacteroidota bacterium]
MYRVYLGLGSNMGGRAENLATALSGISEICTVISVSSVYETEPLGMTGEADFLNMAAAIDTTDDPPLLLARLKKIEKRMGRKTRGRHLPRIIDIDILLYRGMAYEDNLVKVPHPELHNRRFALEPLCEIAPAAVHTTMEKTVGWLLRKCRDTHRVVNTGELAGFTHDHAI